MKKKGIIIAVAVLAAVALLVAGIGVSVVASGISYRGCA